MIKVEIILKQEDMIKFLIQDYFQKGISFNYINSLKRDTVSYWLEFVQNCSNWRWWSAILDVIEAHNRISYWLFKTMFINSSVQKRKKGIKY